MSNLTQLIAANGPTVAPGTVTSAQYYTSVGWSAGEYVYQTPTNAIAPRTTGGLGYNATYNAGSVLSGFSFTPGTLQSVQYSPLYDFGTFTGTSQTAGQQNGTSTTIAAVSSSSLYSFNLINGNICVVYQSGGNAFFTIRTPAGATVLGATLVASSSGVSADVGSVSGCCLTNGTIVITHSDTSNSYWNSYTQTGTVVTARAIFEASNFVRFHQTIALSNGNWAVVGSSTNAQQNLMVLSPTGTVVRSAVATGISSISSSACAQLPNGNIAFAGFDNPNARIGMGVVTQTGTSIWSNYPEGMANFALSVLPLPSNNFVVAFTNSSGQGSVRVHSPTNSTTVFTNNLGTTNISNFSAATLQLSAALVPTVYVAGSGGSGTILYSIAYSNSAGSAATVTTLNSSLGFTVPGTYPFTLTNSLNGRVMLIWAASGTLNPTFGSWNIVTLTNGTSVLTGGNYTPTEGWTLLGVAATTVASGGTGPVITNGGSVALNANYPLVTPPAAFNYQGASVRFAQRGTVSNRVAILQGLEA